MKKLLSESSRGKVITNVAVFIIALVGASRQQYKMDDISYFEEFLIEVFAPIQEGTVTLKEGVSNFFEHYILIANTSRNNVELRKTVETLESQIFTLKELEKENERLKLLMQFGENIPRKKVLAQVVGWDSSNDFKVLRLNKGKKDGLTLMAPVITMNGLVGYVYRLATHYSDILTILDQNNRVDAIVSQTRSHGVVEGTARSKCRLKYVARTDQVKEGDEVITAGLGNVYPKGIKIGTITDIDKENFGITQTIEVTPSVDFHKLEEVVVLIDDGSVPPVTEEKVDEI